MADGFRALGIHTVIGAFWFGVICGLLCGATVAFVVWMMEDEDGG